MKSVAAMIEGFSEAEEHLAPFHEAAIVYGDPAEVTNEVKNVCIKNTEIMFGRVCEAIQVVRIS